MAEAVLRDLGTDIQSEVRDRALPGTDLGAYTSVRRTLIRPSTKICASVGFTSGTVLTEAGVLRDHYWERPVWTLEEFADYVCMSVRQLNRIRAKRDASFPTEMRPGGASLFKKEEVEDWLDGRAVHRKSLWIHPEWKAPPRPQP